jgi:hypothetical protein
MLMSRLLKLALVVDAITTAASGLVLALLGGGLASLLGLPASLLQVTGVILLPYAALVGYLAAREQVTAAAIWAVIVVNVLWAVDSIAVLFTGWVAPTGLGTAFVIFQALVVGALAELQYFGLRASGRGHQPVSGRGQVTRTQQSGSSYSTDHGHQGRA